MNRKIIQISSDPAVDSEDPNSNCLYALCDDGTLWLWSYDYNEPKGKFRWSQIDIAPVTFVPLELFNSESELDDE